MISWNNCRYRMISLLPQNYVFPSMTLTNLLMMWYCCDRSKIIPPYWMIRGSDMREMKGGIQKFSMMKKLVKHLEKGVRIVNIPHLLVQNCTLIHVLDLYYDGKLFFLFPSLKRRRRLKKSAWKNYCIILCVKKGYLVGEKVPKN